MPRRCTWSCKLSNVDRPIPLNNALLDWVACPRCKGRLQPTTDGAIVDGQLRCVDCGSLYDVVRGVPILLAEVSEADRFTAKNFGEQWEHFYRMGGLGEEFEERQVVEYFYPYDIKRLAGKAVVEAGCGYGRNLLAARRYGASVAIGFDVGPAALLAKARGCDAVIGDILNPPFRREFDVVFSFGVVHHVSDPDRAIQKLSELIAPNGVCCHSVYSAENNWILDNLFTPIRMRVFRHLSSAAKHLFATILGWLSFVVFAVLYVPFSWGTASHAWASKHLFYYDYMILTIRKLGLKQWIGQIYDHLNAPLAAYISRERVERWMDEIGLQNRYVFFRNKNTWNFGGTKC
jgi:SAM-dependent methyltransferase